MTVSHSRREFLRLTAGAAATVTLGTACSSDDESPAAASKRETGSKTKRPTLRIAQWSHFVPAYDTWFDDEYAKHWGDEHDVDVVVDHIPIDELPIRADAEAAARRGHDLFWFLTPRAVLEDDVIDHKELVEEVAARLGPLTPHVERSVRNPKTGRYFGFPDHWVAGPILYRTDLWAQVGVGRPNTWDDVLRAAGPLKALGHPLGLGYSGDLDSNFTVGSLLRAFGASLQDEAANLRINTPATLEAVKMGAAIFKAGMTEEVFTWDASSNNRLLLSGKGSFILNAISALRAAEQENPDLAATIGLAPVPAATAGDLPRGEYGVGTYVIWKFARQQELALQFLVDLALASREAFLRSELYNLPAFPGAVPDLAELVAVDPKAQPPDKYGMLAGATSWMTNIGAPGSTNAAVDEVFGLSALPRMFAAAARGEKTPEQAVADAEAEIKPIFDKWRDRGRI